MLDTDILRFIKKEMNSIDEKKTMEWIRKTPENQKRYNVLKAKYVASNMKNSSNNDNTVFFNQFVAHTKKRTLKRYMFAGIPAIAIVFAFLWFLNTSNIFFSETNSIVNESFGNDKILTFKDYNKEITLPDGSKIILNLDSKLIYPEQFNDSIREVTLIGEAFFDIKRNINKPFIVNVNDLKVKVLGTSFNIKAYNKDEKIETTLVTGKIELLKEKQTPIILAPSQKAVFHKKENKIEVEEVLSSDVVAWREGKLIFNKTSLQEVVKDLERKYKIKIIIKSEKLLNYEYTGTFDNLTINEVLNLLSISSPIKYTINNDNITLE